MRPHAGGRFLFDLTGSRAREGPHRTPRVAASHGRASRGRSSRPHRREGRDKSPEFRAYQVSPAKGGELTWLGCMAKGPVVTRTTCDAATRVSRPCRRAGRDRDATATWPSGPRVPPTDVVRARSLLRTALRASKVRFCRREQARDAAAACGDCGLVDRAWAPGLGIWRFAHCSASPRADSQPTNKHTPPSKWTSPPVPTSQRRRFASPSLSSRPPQSRPSGSSSPRVSQPSPAKRRDLRAAQQRRLRGAERAPKSLTC